MAVFCAKGNSLSPDIMLALSLAVGHDIPFHEITPLP